MDRFPKKHFYSAFLVSILLIAIYLLRVFDIPLSVHPEIIDKYPKFYQMEYKYGFILGGMKSAFDSCNGEACVQDRLTANYCPDPSFCQSRTRNFNYLMDYVDAIFFKAVSNNFGMLSNTLGSILIFYTLIAAFFLYRSDINPIKIVILTSIFLFFPHAMSLDKVLYRSGKIMTVLYTAILFLQYVLLKKICISDSKYRNIAFYIVLFASFLFSAILILSDEMAVYITGMALLVFICRWISNYYICNLEKKILIIIVPYFIILLIFYLIFRSDIEPRLAFYLDGIKLLKAGSYADVSSFIKFDPALIEASFMGILVAFFNSIGANSFFGINYGLIFSVMVLSIITCIYLVKTKLRSLLLYKTKLYFLALICIMQISIFGLYYKYSQLNLFFLPNFFIFMICSFLLTIWSMIQFLKFSKYYIELIGLSILWLICIYLMALRHPYIIAPPYFGSFYYYMPTAFLILLGIVIGLLKSNALTNVKSRWILLSVLLIAIGNYLNVNKYTKASMLFFSQEDNHFISELSGSSKSKLDKKDLLQNDFYNKFFKFFHGLAYIEKSCIYNECVQDKNEIMKTEILKSKDHLVFILSKINELKIGQKISFQITGNKPLGKIMVVIKDKNTNVKLEKQIDSVSDTTSETSAIVIYNMENPQVVLKNIDSFSKSNISLKVTTYKVNTI